MSRVGQPLISIIMNCYNSQQYLKEAIETVINQTYHNWELVFWDNQSTDKSSEIVKSFQDSRIKYFLAPVRTPLGEARNLAAQRASGDWLGFLDCDDIWLTEKLEKQLKIIQEETDSLGLVYSRAVVQGGKYSGCEYAPQYKGRPLPEGDILEEYLLGDNFIPLVSAMIRKDIFDEVGGIPNDYKQSEDFYIFAAVASKYRVRVEQSTTCLYRIHDSNISHFQQEFACEESILVIEKFWPFTKNRKQKLDRKNTLVKRYSVLAGLCMLRYRRNIPRGLSRVLTHPFLASRMVFNYVIKGDRNLILGS